MKWIGQHIYDLVARFRNDVYLEDLSTTTETNVLVVDSDGKVSKTTVITGDVTGITSGSNITVTDPTGPVPTVALNTTLTGLTSITSTSFVGSLTGNADTVTTNANLTGHITSVGNAAVLGSFTSAELLAAITDETGTGAAVFGTSPTLASPIISSISNTGTLTLPTSTDTLVGRDTTDTLKNKTLTEPTITGNGAIAGVFTGNLTGNVTGNLTGNADTVTTNADLTGDITSSGNATTIASGVIINDDISASAGIVDTKLATISTASKVSNSATTATSANTASAIVTRDASGNFSAGTITAALTGNAETATKIASITNSDIVQLTETQTLTNKTLTEPIITGAGGVGVLFNGSTSGTTKIVATAVAGSTKLTLPAATDILVGRATTDTLTNKTLTAPTITGAGAIAGVFTGNITGNVTGNADTVTTNADLTGPVTSDRKYYCYSRWGDYHCYAKTFANV
jgi:trimeric autotransporter adhesin